jgi:hypothetical protein
MRIKRDFVARDPNGATTETHRNARRNTAAIWQILRLRITLLP